MQAELAALAFAWLKLWWKLVAKLLAHVSRPFSPASVFFTLKLHVSLRNHLVYCLDRLPEPDHSFAEARRRVLPEFGGELHYAQIDVRDNKSLDGVIAGIAEKYERPDSLIAAAGI